MIKQLSEAAFKNEYFKVKEINSGATLFYFMKLKMPPPFLKSRWGVVISIRRVGLFLILLFLGRSSHYI